MKDGEWYFDSEDSTVSTTNGDLELEVCKVANFDLYESSGAYGGKYYFGEKSKAHAALLTSAPALLEALEDMHNQECGRYELKSCGHNYVCVCVGDKARTAIAAARGTV